jgi:hypothetical protein
VCQYYRYIGAFGFPLSPLPCDGQRFDSNGGSGELYNAAHKKEWEKVEVRRPLEAVFSTECGPSRGVCMGSGQ